MSAPLYHSKSEAILESLRDLIISGEVLPGEPLRQRDLAERFNVSQTPVREALRRLESEGLVRADLHRGSRVANIRGEDEEESYRILAALEPMATTLALKKMTEADLDEVHFLQQRFERCADDDPDLAIINRGFHFRIYECARSPLLLTPMRLLWQSFSGRAGLWRPHADSVREHRLLVQALEARDSELAAAIVRAHSLGSIEWMRRAQQR
jgi:DNA-binding GntR family transcriptional regulator